MSLEVVYGESRDRLRAGQLAAQLQATLTEGTIYLGYPVLATADQRVSVDALLVSSDHGLAAFQFADSIPQDDRDWEVCIDAQDRLYRALDSTLSRHDSLRRRRQLAVEINTITVFPTAVSPPPSEPTAHFCAIGDVGAVVTELRGSSDEMYHALQAALQRVTTIKPAKRRIEVSRDDSRGAVLKEIEKGIANLDQWQKQAAIESPEGPQRIRGLAGSGKTVVLALKAAYLHSQHPDWQIAVTFQSRSLYQQFEDLISRFCYETSNEPPDFGYLHIFHAWGASNRSGVYKSIAYHLNATARDFNYGASTYGRNAAFEGVCTELLAIAQQSDAKPLFDAVLIDEAQDLPASFFRLVYEVTSEPKRIVWAYDELQNLSEAEMATTEELFGLRPDGTERVQLASTEGEARRDIVLPVCYRNSPWALATAHALGLGIYRDGGLVQYFDDPTLWERIGYVVRSGVFQANRTVELERAESSYPAYFPQLLSAEDAVELKVFASAAEEDAWVAEQIEANLTVDELEHDDILVVLPDSYTSKRRASTLATALARRNIQSHLVGVSNSVDQVFVSDSIAMAHIYRAKGNEAPMVYVLDSQYAAGPGRAVFRRNTIFTAITRSRAWVRICGFGPEMEALADEVVKVRERGFKLRFRVPTSQQLANIRRIHRDRSDEEVRVLEDATRTFDELMRLFASGELDLNDLPPRIRTQLARLARTGEEWTIDK